MSRDIFKEYDNGTVIEAEIIRREGLRDWGAPPFVVESIDGIEVEKDRYSTARSLAHIFEKYDNPRLEIDEGLIPIEVAIDGNPAISTFLHGVHEFSKDEIAETMDVKTETVTKYLRRFR
ncbi:hypothetical protein [Halorientalis halophila]|uniref:hypothetical protein n=1 Tax=Halorientalis halophila TaxID=3108499 RepID=UPI0030093F08